MKKKFKTDDFVWVISTDFDILGKIGQIHKITLYGYEVTMKKDNITTLLNHYTLFSKEIKKVGPVLEYIINKYETKIF